MARSQFSLFRLAVALLAVTMEFLSWQAMEVSATFIVTPETGNLLWGSRCPTIIKADSYPFVATSSLYSCNKYVKRNEQRRQHLFRHVTTQRGMVSTDVDQQRSPTSYEDGTSSSSSKWKNKKAELVLEFASTVQESISEGTFVSLTIRGVKRQKNHDVSAKMVIFCWLLTLSSNHINENNNFLTVETQRC